MKKYGIHWFRRDLRIAGNPALRENWQKHEGRVLGIFFFDQQFLARPDFSHHRFAFFLKTLESLREDLRCLGGDLLVLNSPPLEGFSRICSHLAKQEGGKPQLVSWNRDYEPFARARDNGVEELLKEKFSIPSLNQRDHLVIEPWELAKDDGRPYQVFTPFSRKWQEILERAEFQKRISEEQVGLAFLKKQKNSEPKERSFFQGSWREVLGEGSTFVDQLSAFQEKNQQAVSIEIPAAGSGVAFQYLQEFVEKISSYKDHRDFPALAGTSRLSLFLKNGSLTASQIIAFLQLHRLPLSDGQGPAVFLKQLIWREFYYHILWHHPVVESHAFLEKYRGIRWENNSELFAAWKEGRTGYPIVDAGMRELKATGWMHNRVRMIVASFLTKDLLIDWRWGEKYFMEQLLDGDLAANNGGWQWAASTGCDPQPYFRIFHPTLQSEKFDPQGSYLRKWLPERAKLSNREIHLPIQPVVNHSLQKVKALHLYKQ